MSEPKYLYRYLPFNDFSKDILINNRLWFSSPSSFNDPFDSKILIDFTDSSLDELIKIYRETKWFKNVANVSDTPEEESMLRAKYFLYEGDFIRDGNKAEKQEDFYKKYHYSLEEFFNDSQNQNDIYERGKENIQNHISFLLSRAWGVVSLTENKKDILMWSHYGNSHKGFCLQFSTKHMVEMKEKQQQNKTQVMKTVRISYDSSYHTIKEFLELDKKVNEFHQKVLLRKSPHWNYEKEWRTIYFNADWNNNEDWLECKDRYITFPPEMLTGVIFGCEMKKEDREAIKHLVKSNPKLAHVRFHEAKKKLNEFGLNIEEIK